MNYKKKYGQNDHRSNQEGGPSSQQYQKKWVPKNQQPVEEANTAQEESQTNQTQVDYSKKGQSANQYQKKDQRQPTQQQNYDQQEYIRGYGKRDNKQNYNNNSTYSKTVQGGEYQNNYSQKSDFFEERKAERDYMETAQQQSKSLKYLQDNENVWSKKMDTSNQGKYKIVNKNLGSASQYLGDYEDQKYQNKKQEKIAFFKEEDQSERNLQDQANVKYNYQDFLNQFQNITEQCAYFVESLSKGTIECIICHNPIYQRSALWNCQQCRQPFHLGCIKRWIKKLNNQDDEEEKQVAMNIRTSQNQQDNDDPQAESEARKAAKKIVAFYSWTCPNCNFSYAENKIPRYFCFCGRFDEPEFSPLVLPHSCGEYCDKKKNESCSHSKCDLLCHPGSCPPCNMSVPIKCFCGKETKRVPCQLANKTDFSCENQCDKLLNCLIHQCQKQCHQGACPPCSITTIQRCYCGKEEKEVRCGSKKHNCGEICGKLLDCGKHHCDKICHAGNCQPCQRDPSKVKYCPCGRNLIVNLLGHERKLCTDEIPVCNNICDKFLPCGKHQCKKQCHNDECQRCDQLIEQTCVCGKDKRQIPCYQIFYPDHLKQRMMTTEELDQAEIFKCKKVCNQMKSCNKHKCKEVCCPIKKGTYDPSGRHLCLQTCNKTLSCGKHTCNSFCHLGFCKPCRVVSTQPLYCPCGSVKIDPPIKCEQQQPTCSNPCQNILTCGHKCTLKCHLGRCPPCLQPVTKVCNCGKEIATNVYCNQQRHSCGQECGVQLPCGHQCTKRCHLPGQYYITEEELLKNGCGERCDKPRTTCNHRCQARCHPQTACPETPCDAEIRVYCKCGNRYVNTICKSIKERDPIECNSECWKKQRDKKLATAFGSNVIQGTDINYEYYPEEVLEFAKEHPKFAKKCERMLIDVVLEKSMRSFTGLSSAKKSFLTTLVFENFNLDMCTYGGKSSKTVTDVFWKEGCKVPDILVSELMVLIERGIMSTNNEDNRNMIFEATLYIHDVIKGSTIDDLKKFLKNFKNEMYAEKGKQFGSFYLHFYKKERAKDAFTFLRNSPNQFTNIELIVHKKEIGINQDSLPNSQSATDAKKKKREQNQLDDEGFTVIKKK